MPSHLPPPYRRLGGSRHYNANFFEGDHHITKKLYNGTSKKVHKGGCNLGLRRPSAQHLLGFVASRIGSPSLPLEVIPHLLPFILAEHYVAEMALQAQHQALAKEFDGLNPAAPCRPQSTSYMTAFDLSEHSLNKHSDIICLGVLAGANDGALFQSNQVANSHSLLQSQPEVSMWCKVKALACWVLEMHECHSLTKL